MTNACRDSGEVVRISTPKVERLVPGDCLLASFLIGIILVISVGSFSAGAVAGELAPNFTLTLYDDERELGASSVELADLWGRPVVLNFWAPLCPPCRAEMSDIQRFYQEFKDRVWVIGLDVGRFTDLGSRQQARELLNELGITYATGFSEDESVMQAYEIRGIPTTVFIDAKGEVFLTWHGIVDRDALTSMTIKMLDR